MSFVRKTISALALAGLAVVFWAIVGRAQEVNRARLGLPPGPVPPSENVPVTGAPVQVTVTPNRSALPPTLLVGQAAAQAQAAPRWMDWLMDCLVSPALAFFEYQSFYGGTAGCIPFAGCAAPADVSMAVGVSNGTDYALVHLNDELYVYNADTGTQISYTSASCFWCGCGNDSTEGCEGLGSGDMDPRTMYDSANGRWITSAAAFGSGGTLDTEWTWLAVSKTSDPTNLDPSNWYEYKFKACGDSTDWGDEPGLGMDNKWIVVHDACYTQSGSPVNTDPNLHIFEKAPLYAHTQIQYNLVDSYLLDAPAVTYASSADREWMVKPVVPSSGSPVQEVLSYVLDDVPPTYYQAVATVTLKVCEGIGLRESSWVDACVFEERMVLLLRVVSGY